MSSFRIANYYGQDVKLVINGKRGFVGKLFPDGKRRSQGQSAGTGGNAGYGVPEPGHPMTKKASSKIQRTPMHMRFDKVHGDELIVINRKDERRTFERANIISHQWNDMHNGHMRLQINVETNE